MNCTLTFEQQEIFYRKVLKDLSVIVSDNKDFDIKNYILDFYNLVNDKTNDASLALSYAQLLPDNISTVINDDRNISKYLRAKGISVDALLNLRDSFEDIINVEIPIDINLFKSEYHHFAFRVNGIDGKVSVMCDGKEVQTVNIQPGQYIFQEVFSESINIGNTYFYNDQSLSDYIGQKNYYYLKDYKLKQ